MVKGDIALHVPETMSFEEAAALGVTTITTGRAFHQKLGIPLPPATVPAVTQVLVYGGSSAMGTMVIQFAKLAGLEVLTTCSPRNFDMVKSYGADTVFDYSDAESIERLRASIRGGLQMCFDCISNQFSVDFCEKLLAPGAVYSGIGLAACSRQDVRSETTIGYSFLGERWKILHFEEDAKPEDFKFSVTFAELTERLLQEGMIKPHPLDVRERGIETILSAFEDMKHERVSGRKVVVPL